MAEEREDPEGVRGPPVVLVAVDDDGVIARDSLAAEKLCEARTIDVVAHDRVVQLGVPVHLHGTGDVPGLVEQHVLVGFHDHQARLAEIRGEPFSGDESSGCSVFGEFVG
ncbi:hypothetical protein GCM10025863_08320 [Microbacterium suwonense]|uniref:Uncharacterized protein n=1 Tax=Microbacterium suwonense TaxID=683047 RepID=A0ABM8FRT8_9MICO|nr:hypothetical protein GCM10025863_08320 [Microbacterium suwonense]